MKRVIVAGNRRTEVPADLNVFGGALRLLLDGSRIFRLRDCRENSASVIPNPEWLPLANLGRSRWSGEILWFDVSVVAVVESWQAHLSVRILL